MPFLNLLNIRTQPSSSQPVGTASSIAENDSKSPALPEVAILPESEPEFKFSTSTNSFKVVLVPHNDPARSTRPHSFEPVEKEMEQNMALKLGRPIKTEVKGKSAECQESPNLNGAVASNSNSATGATDRDTKNGKIVETVWFKSKVVSRLHAEIWLKMVRLVSRLKVNRRL